MGAAVRGQEASTGRMTVHDVAELRASGRRLERRHGPMRRTSAASIFALFGVERPDSPALRRNQHDRDPLCAVATFALARRAVKSSNHVLRPRLRDETS